MFILILVCFYLCAQVVRLGIVLIAMNPFARIAIYTNESIAAYQGTKRGDLEPHLFAIGEEAYGGMVKDKVNQTVVVSGERYYLLWPPVPPID